MNNQLHIIALGTADINEHANYIVSISWQIRLISNRLDSTGAPNLVCEQGKTVLDVTQGLPFTDFNEITEEVVAGWVMQSNSYINALQTVQEKLRIANSPATIQRHLPWNT